MDFSVVESATGVVRVLTHKDVPGRNSYATFNPEQPVFCDTEVNFLGDMLALVVADTEAHARAAAKLARVEYEPLPGVFEIEDSYALGGRQIIRTIDFSSGDLAAAEKTPGLQTFEGDYYFERQEHAYIEPECAIGEYDESTGVVRVTTCTQSPFEIQNMLAPILDLPAERIRVTGAPIGGGFGGKCDSLRRAARCHRSIHPSPQGTDTAHAARVADPFDQAPPLPQPLPLRRGRKRYLPHAGSEDHPDAGPYTGLSGGVLEQGCIFALGPYRIDAAKAPRLYGAHEHRAGRGVPRLRHQPERQLHRNDDRRGGRAAGDRSLRDSSPQRAPPRRQNDDRRGGARERRHCADHPRVREEGGAYHRLLPEAVCGKE